MYIDLTVNGSTSKVAILDANGKAPTDSLPVLNVRNTVVTRAVTTRYFNNTGFPQLIHVLFSYNSNSAASGVRVGNKGSDASTYVTFETQASNTTHSQPVNVVVPNGGWYSLNPSSGHTVVRVIETTYFYE